MSVRAIDDHSFDHYIGGPAVVAFVRRKHVECRALLAVLDELAPAYAPRVGFAMVDVQDCPGLAARFEVDRIPTVLLFDDYRGVGRLPDPITQTALARLIETRLGATTR